MAKRPSYLGFMLVVACVAASPLASCSRETAPTTVASRGVTPTTTIAFDRPNSPPIPASKLSEIRPGMTYGEFTAIFGDGWISPLSGAGIKKWFFDDGTELRVVEWESPTKILHYDLIAPPPAPPTYHH
jgi:hypothetical protein